MVTNGDQAIQYLSGQGIYADRQHFPMPCVILLDLNLPPKNGLEILRWQRDHPVVKLIPVIIFTSSGNPDDVRRACELGAAAYLVKLPNPTDWGERACAIRDFWLEHNTPPPTCSQGKCGD